MNGFFKQISLWIVVLIILLLGLTQLSQMNKDTEELWSKDFTEQLLAENIKTVKVEKTSDELYQFDVVFIEALDGGQTRMDFSSDAERDQLYLWIEKRLSEIKK